MRLLDYPKAGSRCLSAFARLICMVATIKKARRLPETSWWSAHDDAILAEQVGLDSGIVGCLSELGLASEYTRSVVYGLVQVW
jgi:hypothetical protein